MERNGEKYSWLAQGHIISGEQFQEATYHVQVVMMDEVMKIACNVNKSSD